MAIPHKPGPAQALSLVGQLGDFPKIPTAVQERFPEMEAWQEEVDRWWNRFGEMFRRDLDSISSQFATDEAKSASDLSAIRADIAAIKQRLASL